MKRRLEVCFDIDECLNRLTFKKYRKYAVAVARTHIERSNLFMSNKIYCFDRSENIKNYSISLKVRKDFEYMNELNEIIKIALEAGFFKRWENDGQPIKLSENIGDFVEISGPILSDAILFTIGFSVIILVVSAEMVAGKRLESLNRHNFNIFMHKSLGAQRQFFSRRNF